MTSSLTVLAGLSSDHTGGCVWGNIPNLWIFHPGESKRGSVIPFELIAGFVSQIIKKKFSVFGSKYIYFLYDSQVAAELN